MGKATWSVTRRRKALLAKIEELKRSKKKLGKNTLDHTNIVVFNVNIDSQIERLKLQIKNL